MLLLEILSSLTIAHLLIFLAIFTIFTLIDFRCKNYHYIQEKSVLLWKNSYILSVEYFSLLKHSFLIGLCEVTENFCMDIFAVVLRLPSHAEPLQQNMMIKYWNESNTTNVSTVKKKTQNETPTYNLVISKNLH